MKRILSVLILFLLFNNSNAQRVKYSVLKYVLTHNIDETADYLTRLGFSFGGIDTLYAERQNYIYTFTKNSSHSKDFIEVSKNTLNGVFCASAIYTVYKTDYLALKDAVKQLGYKLESTKPNDSGSLVITYKKSNLEMQFLITYDKKTDVTDYYISLQDENIKH